MSTGSSGNAAAVSAAKSAREELAKGLNALQGGPDIPPTLLELAAPIAQAMGALHQIERSNGAELAPHAEAALNHVRAALAQLQAQPQSHPAVIAAMEAVASSLGHVHSLSKMSGQSFPPGKPAPVPGAVTGHEATHLAPQAAVPASPPWAPPPQAAPPYVAPAPVHVPVAAPAPVPTAPVAQAHANPYAAPAAAASPAASPYAANVPHAAAKAAPAPSYTADPFAAPAGGRAPAPTPARASRPVPAPPAADGAAQLVIADLGAHSQTNFYKGLAGNDIIDHGGLFVSTYMVPKIGTAVRLKVSLPGGYEFEANAVVRWAREVSGVGDAPPGFGAQFTQISQEARQLVYRYVRNREPLFYDDL